MINSRAVADKSGMMRCSLRPSYDGTLDEAICRTIHQNIGSPLICLFCMHEIIWQRYMVFLHSIFLFCTTDFFLSFFLSFFYLYATIRQKYMVLFRLFFLLCMAIWQKYMVFFHLFFLLCTIIRLKIKVHTDLFLYMYTTIQKVTVLISWFILFAQDHSILFHLFFL